MKLPQMPVTFPKNKSEMVMLKSINFSDMTEDGNLIYSKNISTRRFPYITTSMTREVQNSIYDNAIALYTRDDGIISINKVTENNNTFAVAKYNGVEIKDSNGNRVSLSTDNKQIATVNTKTLIFPDFAVIENRNVPIILGNNITFGKATDTITGSNITFANESNKGKITITNASAENIILNSVIGISVYQGSPYKNNDGNYSVISVAPTGTANQYVITVNRTFNKEGTYDGTYTITYQTGQGTISATNSALSNINTGDTITIKITDASSVYKQNNGEYIVNSITHSNDTYTITTNKVPIEIGTYAGNYQLQISNSYTIKIETSATITVNSGTIYFYAEYNSSNNKFEGKIKATDSNLANIQTGDVITLKITSGNGDYTANEGNYTVISVASTGTTNQYVITTKELPKLDGHTTVGWNITYRKIPNLDFICECENRLWGCSNVNKTIYASALGEPTQFNEFDGTSTDSYAVAVGSEGDFTGCCKYGSSVMFFKENYLHKILGSYPAEYTLYTYNIDGLQKGSEKSLQLFNDVIYYNGLHGVYAYSGNTPYRISNNFGEKKFTDAVSGNDGERYYMSCKDGTSYRLLVYDTKYKIWLQEDDIKCDDFTRIGDKVYFINNDKLYLENYSETDNTVEWEAHFTPFYETIQGKKTYSTISIRVELARGSYIKTFVKTDEKMWQNVNTLTGGFENVQTIRIPINRCDKFELKFTGKGYCTIRSILREFGVGSEV